MDFDSNEPEFRASASIFWSEVSRKRLDVGHVWDGERVKTSTFTSY